LSQDKNKDKVILRLESKHERQIVNWDSKRDK